MKSMVAIQARAVDFMRHDSLAIHTYFAGFSRETDLHTSSDALHSSASLNPT